MAVPAGVEGRASQLLDADLNHFWEADRIIWDDELYQSNPRHNRAASFFD